MSFAAVSWLLAIFPWTALAAWLLTGRRERVGVPFLELWSGPVTGPRPKRAIAAPPVAVVLAMLAALAAIVAAAGPRVRMAGSSAAARPTVIVDRGVAMSTRFKSLAHDADAAFRDRLGSASIHLAM